MSDLPLAKRVENGVRLLTERFNGLEWIDYVSISGLDMANQCRCVGGQLAVMMAPNEEEKAAVLAYDFKFFKFAMYIAARGRPETEYGLTWVEEYGFVAVEGYEELEGFAEDKELLGEDLIWSVKDQYWIMTQLWIDHIARLHRDVYGTDPEEYAEVVADRSTQTLALMEEAKA